MENIAIDRNLLSEFEICQLSHSMSRKNPPNMWHEDKWGIVCTQEDVAHHGSEPVFQVQDI